MSDSTDPTIAPGEPVPVETRAASGATTRKPAFWRPVAGGAVAALIGFGVAQVIPVGPGSSDISTIQAQMAAQDARVKALEASVSHLSEAPVVSEDKALVARVTAIEQSMATTPAPVDTAPLAERITVLEGQIAARPGIAASSGSVDQKTLMDLQTEVDAMKSAGISALGLDAAQKAMDDKVAEVEARLAAVKTQADASAAATARQAAVMQIAAALDSGAPFASALSSLKSEALAPVLTDHANRGLPTLQDLKLRFDDAARQALEASLKANQGTSWSERVTAFLKGQTGARSLAPREGSDPDAVLSRAQAAVDAGDLAAALSELKVLPTEGLAAMADWLADAKLRQDAVAAVQTLAATSGQ